jgi:hypothetical protein
MIALPPLETGAVHDNETCPLPRVGVTEVGVPGVVNGVTLDEAVENVPRPAPLIAATRNVYAVPFVNPVTVTEAVVDTESLKVVHVVPLLEY